MKIDQDLCRNLWYELNPRVRCAFGNVCEHGHFCRTHKDINLTIDTIPKEEECRTFVCKQSGVFLLWTIMCVCLCRHTHWLVRSILSHAWSAKREQLTNGFTFEASSVAVTIFWWAKLLWVLLGQLRESKPGTQSFSDYRATPLFVAFQVFRYCDLGSDSFSIWREARWAFRK